jgi:phosphoglycolate phosphatase-like HAD superfamily hydrolase
MPMTPSRSFASTSLALTLLLALALSASHARAEDPLGSWAEGATKKAILSFVGRATTAGGPDFVPEAERIATFDNDGTLWAEQPLYFQLLFALDRVKALAPQHPTWKEQEPFASLLKGDVKGALAGGEKAIAEIMAASHAGMTSDEFASIVRDWIATAKHPKLKRAYTELAYQPMLELLAFLRAHGFKTFIVSGGGVEFMRAFAEKLYGIPPEQVIGSAGKQAYELRAGKPVLVKLPGVEFIDDREGKAIAIQRIIGRRPTAAFGNSDGDQQMLQWTCSNEGLRFCLLVHHTDPKREWAYDRKSSIGQLDKALDEARTKGWSVVDMKRDWKVIFPFEPKPSK